MSRDALGPPFEMEGAFNDVALTLGAGASEREVIARLDRLLEPWGGLGAYGREDQVSHRFISDEIAQNRVFGTVVPAIFLGVAAFLLNVVLSRLVATQREQIAVLKAFGYRDRAIAFHYLGFALVAVALGAALGVLAGLWLGARINELYVELLPLPGAALLARRHRDRRRDRRCATLAAVIGALGAVRRVLALAAGRGDAAGAARPLRGGLARSAWPAARRLPRRRAHDLAQPHAAARCARGSRCSARPSPSRSCWSAASSSTRSQTLNDVQFRARPARGHDGRLPRAAALRRASRGGVAARRAPRRALPRGAGAAALRARASGACHSSACRRATSCAACSAPTAAPSQPSRRTA